MKNRPRHICRGRFFYPQSGGASAGGRVSAWCSLALSVLCWFAFQCAALFLATVLALRERPIPASFAPLAVYIYGFGGESCRNRLTLEGSARLGPTKLRFCSKTLFLWAFRSAFSLAPQNATRFSAVTRPETKPRMAPSGAGLTAQVFVTRFGEKLVSSRALHPPSAARYFVAGIPAPRLARVRWRITRTGASPFPCARSSHMRR